MTVGTMSKCHPMSTEEVYTVGFVPPYLLPHNRPNALDPFLEPLVADLENSFIEGKYIPHTQSARKYRKNSKQQLTTENSQPIMVLTRKQSSEI